MREWVNPLSPTLSPDARRGSFSLHFTLHFSLHLSLLHSFTPSPEDLLHAADARYQRVDFRHGVIERERRTRRRRNPEALHHRLRAVVAGADRHTLLIEQRADVVRMHA